MVRYILPLGFIFFAVVGLIFLGIATPSEAAATGTLAAFILATAYRKLNWQVFKKTMIGTTNICVMMFMIMMTSKIYAQLLAHSGATQGLVEYISQLPLSTVVLMIVLQIVPLLLGMFMGATAVVMITIPLVMPIVRLLGIDQVLYAITLLLCIEMGTTSPPYGLSLFIMKAVAPRDTTMGDIYRSALPFLGCDLIALILIIIIPSLTGWLPSIMH
jgi:tripartite ATP-independent transporter DctM subunit